MYRSYLHHPDPSDTSNEHFDTAVRTGGREVIDPLDDEQQQSTKRIIADMQVKASQILALLMSTPCPADAVILSKPVVTLSVEVMTCNANDIVKNILLEVFSVLLPRKTELESTQSYLCQAIDFVIGVDEIKDNLQNNISDLSAQLRACNAVIHELSSSVKIDKEKNKSDKSGRRLTLGAGAGAVPRVVTGAEAGSGAGVVAGSAMSDDTDSSSLIMINMQMAMAREVQ